jgi:hypothetical protein
VDDRAGPPVRATLCTLQELRPGLIRAGIVEAVREEFSCGAVTTRVPSVNIR